MDLEGIVLQSGRISVKVTGTRTGTMLFDNVDQVEELATKLMKEVKRIRTIVPVTKPRYVEAPLFT